MNGQPKCKGLIFKVTENMYWDGKAINERRSIRLMKRKSCNCPACEFVVKEFLPELGRGYDFVGNDLITGKLYEMIYTLDEDGECDFRFERWNL